MVGIGKRLNNAVVCDGNTRHSPFIGLLYNVFYLGNSVHITHLGMAVELHSLHISVVNSLDCKVRDLLDADNGLNREFMVKSVNCSNSFDLNKSTHLDALCYIGHICCINEHLDCDGICKVSHSKDENGLVISDVSLIPLDDLAVNGDFTQLAHKINKLHSLIIEVSSKENIRIIGPFVASAEISFAKGFLLAIFGCKRGCLALDLGRATLLGCFRSFCFLGRFFGSFLLCLLLLHSLKLFDHLG